MSTTMIGLRHGPRSLPGILTMLGLVLHAMAAPAQTGNSQTADAEWVPVVAEPSFPADAGPLILVDAAHGNFHTIDGRYSAFAGLLRLDGYRVRSADSPVTPEVLARGSLYVVANALAGGDDAEWILPTPPAFTPDEIRVIVDWVRDGGALLLIADHMPFPGATADLANAFGIVFLNGFALQSLQGSGALSFSRDSGSLADHPVTRGRTVAERVDSVRSFTGQAFRYVSPVEPLLFLPDDWIVLLPEEAWVFDTSTPRVSARGLIQGGILQVGGGRVAVFGEAAMFTAQTAVRDGVASPMGMNHPAATQNAQFVLNVVHWLTGLIDAP